jgi:hypothetical protein
MAENEDFDYENLGVGRTSYTPLPENEVQVHTSSATSNAAEDLLYTGYILSGTKSC